MTRATRVLGLAFVLLAVGACQTVRRKRPRPAPPPVVERAVPVRLWNVVQGEDVVGEVVRYDSVADGRPVFVVRNAWRQDLGVVDRLGRAYRFRPHTDEPEWLGTGTVLEGTARILEAPSAQLQEAELRTAAAPSLDLWASSEVGVLEASLPRESASREAHGNAAEIPGEAEGTPQSREGGCSKDCSEDSPPA